MAVRFRSDDHNRGSGALEQATAAGHTIGVEEEFLLVDAITGRTAPRAAAVLTTASTGAFTGALSGAFIGAASATGAVLQSELLCTQVEAATGVCVTTDELRSQLRAGRVRLAEAARAEGAMLISSGTPILAETALPGTTAGARFDRIASTYAGVVADYQVCGCHVHIGIPDRDTAVAVVNHLARWLPTLLALSGNSPFRHGIDTGYASWRMVEQSRFPGSGLAPWCASAADYDEQVARLVDCGALVDERMSFWVARPSSHLPTVEFRVADAASTVEEAVLQAALSRALVRTALAALATGREAPAVRGQVAAAAMWSAARHGLDGPGVDLVAERQVPAVHLVDDLLSWVSGALEETGDLGRVTKSVTDLVDCGIGAEHQRRAGVHGLRAVVTLLGARTVSGA